MIPALATKFRVIAPDMVGFGYSERPKDIDYGVQTWADQAIGLMDTLGIEKASLVGTASAARLPFGWPLSIPSVSTSWS